MPATATTARALARGIRQDMANVQRGVTNSRYSPRDVPYALTAARVALADAAELVRVLEAMLHIPIPIGGAL